MTEDPGLSDEAVQAATGRSWQEWQAFLDAGGAADLSHAKIVEMVSEAGIGRWWRQMVAVGYERMVGKRAPGQACNGSFSANASRTLAGDKDQALALWCATVEGLKDFDGVQAASQPRQSQTEAWRYWRLDLEDGSKVSVVISDESAGKAVIAIGHEKLVDVAAKAQATLYWKSVLARLPQV